MRRAFAPWALLAGTSYLVFVDDAFAVAWPQSHRARRVDGGGGPILG